MSFNSSNKGVGIFFLAVLLFLLLPSFALADLYLQSNTGSIFFNTSGSARMQISSGGNLALLGQTNLSVGGNALLVDSTGTRVGVGTSTLRGYLTINGSSATRPSINIQNGSQPSSPAHGDIYSDGSDLFFYDGGQWRDLTVDGASSAGGWNDNGASVVLTAITDFVGIGTNAPNEKLTVSGNASITGDVVIGGNLLAAGGSGSGAGTLVGWADDGGIVRLATGSDLVGIGTVDAQSTLHINGSGTTAGFRVTNQSGSNTFFVNSSNGRVQFASLISCDTIDTDSNGVLSCGTDAGGAGTTFNNQNFTILYDARTDRFLIANFTSQYDLRSDRFANSNFTTLYDARSDRFSNANFTAQLAAASVTTNQFNSSGSQIYLNDSNGALGIRTRPTGNVALEVAGKINATYLNITGRDQNATFMGDVQIIGTLYGGSPVKISGGLNVSGVSQGQDAIFVTNESGDKIIRITSEGQINFSSQAGNTTFDNGTFFVDNINNRVGIGTTTPTTALQVMGTITATSFVGDGSGLSGVSGGIIFTYSNITSFLGDGGNSSIIRAGNLSGYQIESSSFKNSNFTTLYDARSDRFLLSNYTALENAAFQNSNFSTLYDARSDRFTNSNFSAQLALSGASSSPWNSSGSNVYLNDSFGKVMIGSSVSAEKLSVIGNVSASGNLTIGNNKFRLCGNDTSGFFEIRDVDDAGWTKCYALNGVLTCTIGAGSCA